MRRGRWAMVLLPALSLAGSTSAALAQGMALPNASFEAGRGQPDDWSAGGDGGQTTWENAGHIGRHSVSVSGGKAPATTYWLTKNAALEPGQLYRFSFWSKTEQAGSGCIISGPGTLNHDFRFTPAWQQSSYVFVTPPKIDDSSIRVGQWDGTGKTYFDDVSLTKLAPLHARRGSLELGEGEEIRGGVYQCHAPLGSSNYARSLARFTAGFNSDRWLMGGDAEVVYRHQVGDYRQKSARVHININYYEAGHLQVEASRDGKTWMPVADAGKQQSIDAALPPALFPAKAIFVRLRSAAPEREARDSSPGSFQIDDYAYTAVLADNAPDASGGTTFLEQRVTNRRLPVTVLSLGDLRPGGSNSAHLIVDNTSGRPMPLEVQLALSAEPLTRPQARDRSNERRIALPGKTKIDIPYKLRQAGAFTLALTLSSAHKPLYQAATEFRVPALYAADYGYRVGSRSDVWWAEAPYKISRQRPLPTAQSQGVQISAARNEYEPFQVVARPHRDIHGMRVVCDGLRGPNGARIERRNISICEVAYVPVAQPTDSTGASGLWPDPLPPLSGPIDVKANRNQPFWITVYVPESARPGWYDGVVKMSAPGWACAVPVQLLVRRFALPKETHVQSGFGLSPGLVRRYHNLQTEGELASVMDKYYRNFAEHRVAPFDPVWNAPIKVDVLGGPGGAGPPRVQVDFAAFDQAAARAFARYHFTAWRLPLEGFGHGTFAEHVPGRLGPYPEGTAEYEALMAGYLRQLQDHLEQKGWLANAYTYWFDEPQPKDYPFVRAGMERIKKYAPKLTRLLTVQPTGDLAGDVDLWCMLTNNYDPGPARQRQRAGDRLWWYICTGPKAPYATLFIDHPAVELRTWLWQTWKHHVQGILVWETTYWTSPAAYPNALQNPWRDPMSWVSGYGQPAGSKAPWGNGDGRFLYPPNRRPGVDQRKYLEGPINSIRWEMLREGIEDYEYFYLLREKVRQARRRGVKTAAARAALADAEKLLQVPASVTTELTQFSPSPQPMLRHREKLAQAIEAL